MLLGLTPRLMWQYLWFNSFLAITSISCVTVKDVREWCFTENLFFKTFIMFSRLRFSPNTALIIIWEDLSVKDCTPEAEARFNWGTLGLALSGLLSSEMVSSSSEFSVLVSTEAVPSSSLSARDCVSSRSLFVSLPCGKCKKPHHKRNKKQSSA